MKFKVNPTKLDFIAITIALVFSIILSFVFFTNKTAGSYVEIYVQGELVETLRLDEDQEFTLYKDEYPCLLDDMVIQIKDNRVRVEKEESPRNICSKQGWFDTPNLPIVCLPNSVLVMIVGEGEDFDGIIYVEGGFDHETQSN